ncbi:hypothetical protein RU06_10305 [Curtobacterium flaccumfaciens]|nr:hypothetical protein RU06_10305 [Curtobacterium flaccumfaciens]VXB61679.1 hypothetical protein CURTO8I2_220239 [Curtobacterium sp. 8I-2]
MSIIVFSWGLSDPEVLLFTSLLAVPDREEHSSRWCAGVGAAAPTETGARERMIASSPRS